MPIPGRDYARACGDGKINIHAIFRILRMRINGWDGIDQRGIESSRGEGSWDRACEQRFDSEIAQTEGQSNNER